MVGLLVDQNYPLGSEFYFYANNFLCFMESWQLIFNSNTIFVFVCLLSAHEISEKLMVQKKQKKVKRYIFQSSSTKKIHKVKLWYNTVTNNLHMNEKLIRNTKMCCWHLTPKLTADQTIIILRDTMTRSFQRNKIIIIGPRHAKRARTTYFVNFQF